LTSAADDIEGFVASLIVQPPPPSPPPFNTDTDENISEPGYCHTSLNDVIVTSAGTGHLTSINSVSYPPAGCIDKTTVDNSVYVNLPVRRRPSDLPPRPPQTRPCGHYDPPPTDPRLQATAGDAQWTFNRRSLRWHDALRCDRLHSESDDKTRHNVAATAGLRPISLQQE